MVEEPCTLIKVNAIIQLSKETSMICESIIKGLKMKFYVEDFKLEAWRLSKQEAVDKTLANDINFVQSLLNLCTVYESSEEYLLSGINNKMIESDWGSEEYKKKHDEFDFDLKKDLSFALDILTMNRLNELDRSIILIYSENDKKYHLKFAGRNSVGIDSETYMNFVDKWEKNNCKMVFRTGIT
jgi:hypothetical protein